MAGGFEADNADPMMGAEPMPGPGQQQQIDPMIMQQIVQQQIMAQIAAQQQMQEQALAQGGGAGRFAGPRGMQWSEGAPGQSDGPMPPRLPGYIPQGTETLRQAPSTWDQVKGGALDPSFYMQMLEAGGGMTGAPAGSVINNAIGAARQGMSGAGVVGNVMGDAMSALRDLPGKVGGAVTDAADSFKRGYSVGNRTKAEQATAEAQRAAKRELQTRTDLYAGAEPRWPVTNPNVPPTPAQGKAPSPTGPSATPGAPSTPTPTPQGPVSAPGKSFDEARGLGTPAAQQAAQARQAILSDPSHPIHDMILQSQGMGPRQRLRVIREALDEQGVNLTNNSIKKIINKAEGAHVERQQTALSQQAKQAYDGAMQALPGDVAKLIQLAGPQATAAWGNARRASGQGVQAVMKHVKETYGVDLKASDVARIIRQELAKGQTGGQAGPGPMPLP